MRKVTQFFREQKLLTNKFSTPEGVKIQASSRLYRTIPDKILSLLRQDLMELISAPRMLTNEASRSTQIVSFFYQIFIHDPKYKMANLKCKVF